VEVAYDAGVRVPGAELWLDPYGVKPFAFVSHAHSDHLRAHGVVFASEATAALARERLGKRARSRYTTLAFGCEARLGDVGLEGPGQDWRVKLLPAGHILGSAMLRVEGDRGSLLYTGDFKLREGRAAERCRPERADVLVMETTFGLPRYAMPPSAEVEERIVTFCRDALEESEVPVLFAYSLGKAQEIMALLGTAGLPLMLHEAVASMARVYENCGMRLPPWRQCDGGKLDGHVVICPPGSEGAPAPEGVVKTRTAAVTGWAMDPGAVYRYGCDAVFPLTDHADYPDLLRMVELVGPKKVFTVHGFAVEFASDLRARGVEAWALGRENQLEMREIVAGL